MRWRHRHRLAGQTEPCLGAGTRGSRHKPERAIYVVSKPDQGALGTRREQSHHDVQDAEHLAASSLSLAITSIDATHSNLYGAALKTTARD